MKMKFTFLILVLCSIQCIHSMDLADRPDAIDPLLPVAHTAPKRIFTKTTPPNPTHMLIKACSNENPTPNLIGYLLGNEADVNEVVGNTTALVVAVENPTTEENSDLLEMLLPHATEENKARALKRAVEMEKVQTIILLQRHEVALPEEDLDEPSPFIEWIKQKASAAKAGIAHAIKQIRSSNSSDDQNHDTNDDLIAQTAIAASNECYEKHTSRDLIYIEDLAI